MRKPKIDLVGYEEMNCLQDFISDLRKLVFDSNMSEAKCKSLFLELEKTYRKWIDNEYNEFLISPVDYYEDRDWTDEVEL